MKRIRLSKKAALIIGAAGLLVVLLLGYAFYSLRTWQGYVQNYESSKRAIKDDLSTAMLLPMTSLAERTQKLTKLKEASTELKIKQANLCTLNSLTGWQAYFSKAKKAQDQCREVASRIDSFANELDAVTAYLTSERALVDLFATVARDGSAKMDEKGWDQSAKTWQKLNASIIDMKVISSFESTKTVATKAVKRIDASWQALLAAHVAKNKDQFVKARTNLVLSYEVLATISTENDEQLRILDKNLMTAYDKAF